MSTRMHVGRAALNDPERSIQPNFNAPPLSAAVRHKMLGKILFTQWTISLILTAQGADYPPLFDSAESTVTFKLKDKEGNTPRLVLFRKVNQALTAESINFLRGTVDSKQSGVVVEFKGIRFVQSMGSDDLVVRLVGIKNELELPTTISTRELESGKVQKLHFGPTTMGGGPVSGITDTEMALRYDSDKRTLSIPSISGQFEWRQLLADPQKDSGSLKDITGDIGELPTSGSILKATPKAAAS